MESPSPNSKSVVSFTTQSQAYCRVKGNNTVIKYLLAANLKLLLFTSLGFSPINILTNNQNDVPIIIYYFSG